MTLPCAPFRVRRGPPQVVSLKGPGCHPADRALFLDDDREPAEDGRS